MKTINQFLKELSPQLASTEYTERFKSELADHLEDAQYHLAVTGVDGITASTQALENVGSVKQLSDNFNKTMKYRNTYQVILEATLNGLLVIPLVFMASTLGQIIFEAYHRFFLQDKLPEFYTEGGSIEIMAIPIAIIILLVLFTSSLIVVIICYWQINKRLRQFVHEPKQKLLALLGVAIPALLLLVPRLLHYIAEYNFNGMGGKRIEETWAGLLSTCIVLLVTGLAIYWSVQVNKITLPKSVKKFSGILQHGLGVITTFYLLLTTIVPNPTFNIFRHGVDVMLYIITLALPLGPYWLRIYLSGGVVVLVALLCVYGLIQYFRKQSPVGSMFPWLKLVVIIYIVILFSASPTTTQNVQWYVPAADVSQDIEYRLVGPFTGIADYWQNLLNPAESSFINGYFDYTKNNTAYYQFDNLTNTSGYTIEYGDVLWTIDSIDATKQEPNYQLHRQYFYRYIPSTKQNVPAELSCIDYTGKLIDKIKKDVNLCSMLYYNQSPIVQLDNNWIITRLRLDTLSHTALLQLSKRDGSAGDVVYLITLP